MVPKGWKVQNFFDIAEINPKKNERTADGIVSFVPMDAVSESAVLIKRIERQYEDVNKGFTSFCDGDVLIAKITPCFENGKGAYLEGLTNGVGFGSTEFHVLRAKKEHCGKFIYYITTTDQFRIRGEQNMQGSAGQKRVTTNYLKRYKILVPPLPEQQKIAKILSVWDAAIDTTNKLLANSQQQKKALMQQLLTGKKRLPGFSGEWKYSLFKDLFKVANDKKTQVKSEDYLDFGTTPIIDQGKRYIAGFTNNLIVYNDIPVIIFGDHTRIVKWIDFRFSPGADGTQVIKSKPILNMKLGYYLIANTVIPNLGYSRHMRELKEKDFKLPVNLEEQQKIASVLSSADQEIDTLQQKLACLQQEKKALMQQLLTGKRRVKLDNASASFNEVVHAQ